MGRRKRRKQQEQTEQLLREEFNRGFDGGQNGSRGNNTFPSLAEAQAGLDRAKQMRKQTRGPKSNITGIEYKRKTTGNRQEEKGSTWIRTPHETYDKPTINQNIPTSRRHGRQREGFTDTHYIQKSHKTRPFSTTPGMGVKVPGRFSEKDKKAISDIRAAYDAAPNPSIINQDAKKSITGFGGMRFRKRGTKKREVLYHRIDAGDGNVLHTKQRLKWKKRAGGNHGVNFEAQIHGSSDSGRHSMKVISQKRFDKQLAKHDKRKSKGRYAGMFTRGFETHDVNNPIYQKDMSAVYSPISVTKTTRKGYEKTKHKDATYHARWAVKGHKGTVLTAKGKERRGQKLVQKAKRKLGLS